MVHHLVDGRLSCGNVLHGLRAGLVVRRGHGRPAILRDDFYLLGGYFYNAGNVLRVGLFRADVACKTRREKFLARKARANHLAVDCRISFHRAACDVYNFGKPPRADNLRGILHDAFLGRALSAGAVLVFGSVDDTLSAIGLDL